MGMELKTTDDPHYVEIHDGTGPIGHLCYLEPEDGESGGWGSELRGFPYSGIRSGPVRDSAAEAFAALQPLYEELLEVRRTAAKFHKNHKVSVISTPMGGKPR
ncbi:hypothetical protein [Streptomyces antibioticus]|uniref:hypothetical protein n=1 Tax=Streptomyces antibioticus TaxID=1890 RepID=UPI0033F1C479